MPKTTPDKDRDTAGHLAPVLAAVAERIHYAEARRANYSVMAGVLFAAGVTIFTFAFGAIDVLPLRWAAALAAMGMIATGLLIIWLFGQQTNRYPFTAATQTWKWFYRDALPDASKFNISWHNYIPWFNGKDRAEREYTGQLASFKTSIARVESANVSLSQDVEQLYTLHITESYKNTFLKHLSRAFNWGLVAIVALGVAGFIAGSEFDRKLREVRSFSSQQGDVRQSLQAKLITSSLATAPIFVVRATLSNNTNCPLEAGTLEAFDGQGWPVPLEVTRLGAETTLVAARSQTTFTFSVKVPSGYASRINRFSLSTK